MLAKQRLPGGFLEAKDAGNVTQSIIAIDPKGEVVPLPLLREIRECSDGRTANWALKALLRRSPDETEDAEQVRASLILLGKALAEYSKANRALPPAAIVDKNGKPLLSWRVSLLPFLGKQELFQKFRLEESWDSPHNRELLPLMPTVFAALLLPKDNTFCQVITGKGTLFDGNKAFPLPEDSSLAAYSQPLIVEARQAVPWTKPEDVVIGEDRRLPNLGALFPDRLYVWFAHGIRLLSVDSLKGLELQKRMASGDYRAIDFHRFGYPARETASQSAPPPGPPPEKTARLDRHGDLLPPGAIQRLGTTRLRHPPLMPDPHFNVTDGKIAFSPDSKTLASFDGSLRLWDVASGKELFSAAG